MPSDTHICWKCIFTFSSPLPYLIDLIFFLRLFSAESLKTLNVSNISYFRFRKYTQQYFEHSSMKVIKYMDPFIDVVGIGPKTSLCIRSSVEVALVYFPTSYIFSGCFPTKQIVHTPSWDLMRDKPSTNLSLCSCCRYLKFRCPNLSCHIFLVLLAWVNKAFGYEIDGKWEKSYSLKAWLETHFAIIF